jgi:hypothetical protein
MAEKYKYLNVDLDKAIREWLRTHSTHSGADFEILAIDPHKGIAVVRRLEAIYKPQV